MNTTNTKWLLPLCIGALVPVFIWFAFFRDPMAGATGVRMSQARKGAQALGMTTDDIITTSEIENRVKKSKHISSEDWRKIHGYLYSKNKFLRSSALNLISLADQPEYREQMIAAARQALQDAQSADQDPIAADFYQARGLHVLWIKNATDWQTEFRRLQALPRKGMMTKDYLEEIQSHQR